jgi:hypothetical protein
MSAPVIGTTEKSAKTFIGNLLRDTPRDFIARGKISFSQIGFHLALAKKLEYRWYYIELEAN